MNELVSVIIPVYNVADYLPACIESVKAQTYKEIQIILVDDGSNDGSGELCDKAATEDERITVIHRENGGLSAARNTGIAAAKGEFICFLDSDDLLDADFVERLYVIAKEKSADVVACGFVRFGDDSDIAKNNDSEKQEKVTEYSNKQAVREVIKERNVKSVAWNKLYKSSLFKELKFPEGKLHEDEFFINKIL